MLAELCLVLMYVNHLLSFYADYTHFTTSFCEGSECTQYFHDESSIDPITAKDCVKCNNTYFDNMILPHRFEQSRIALLKFCSVFFTIESVGYLAMAIAFRFRQALVIKPCLAYLVLTLVAFFVTGIVAGNPLLTANYWLFNFSNFYLLVRIYLIDRSLDSLNEQGWRSRVCKYIRMEVKKFAKFINRLGRKN